MSNKLTQRRLEREFANNAPVFDMYGNDIMSADPRKLALQRQIFKSDYLLSFPHHEPWQAMQAWERYQARKHGCMPRRTAEEWRLSNNESAYNAIQNWLLSTNDNPPLNGVDPPFFESDPIQQRRTAVYYAREAQNGRYHLPPPGGLTDADAPSVYESAEEHRRRLLEQNYMQYGRTHPPPRNHTWER
jgi:hypothetical protein